MKILIIGGTRFFGYHTAKQLSQEGHHVTLFNRGHTPDDLGDRVARIHGDRYDHKSFRSQLEGMTYDVVVDMIAYKAEDSQNAVETFLGNVGHFIHISTAAVYIVTKDYSCPLREEDFDRPLYAGGKKDDELWSYAFHKRKCEETLMKAHSAHGFPATLFRLPIVMGERDYTLRAYSYFLRIQDRKPLILPDGGLNVFTHVYQGDVVRAIVSNLHNAQAFGKAYNLAQEEIITLKDFVLKAAEILGVEVKLVSLPSEILIRSSLGVSFSPLFSRRPFVLDVERARQELRYSSTPWEVWMEKTVRWFVEDYRGGPPADYKLREKEVKLAEMYMNAVKSFSS
jgi:dTDP-glucose 4,6-dehydratase